MSASSSSPSGPGVLAPSGNARPSSSPLAATAASAASSEGCADAVKERLVSVLYTSRDPLSLSQLYSRCIEDKSSTSLADFRSIVEMYCNDELFVVPHGSCSNENQEPSFTLRSPAVRWMGKKAQSGTKGGATSEPSASLHGGHMDICAFHEFLLRLSMSSRSGACKETLEWTDIKFQYRKATDRQLSNEELNAICGTVNLTRKELLQEVLAGILEAVDPDCYSLRPRLDYTKGAQHVFSALNSDVAAKKTRKKKREQRQSQQTSATPSPASSSSATSPADSSSSSPSTTTTATHSPASSSDATSYQTAPSAKVTPLSGESGESRVQNDKFFSATTSPSAGDKVPGLEMASTKPGPFQTQELPDEFVMMTPTMQSFEKKDETADLEQHHRTPTSCPPPQEQSGAHPDEQKPDDESKEGEGEDAEEMMYSEYAAQGDTTSLPPSQLPQVILTSGDSETCDSTPKFARQQTIRVGRGEEAESDVQKEEEEEEKEVGWEEESQMDLQASGVTDTDSQADPSASFGDIFVDAENDGDVSDELYRSGSGSTTSTTTTTTTITSSSSNSSISSAFSGMTNVDFVGAGITVAPEIGGSDGSGGRMKRKVRVGKVDEKGEGEGGSAEKVGRLQSSCSNNSTNSNRLAFRSFPLRNSTTLNRIPPSLESKKHSQDVQAMFKPPPQQHFLTSTRYQRLTPSTFANLDSCDSERSEKDEQSSREGDSQEKVPTKEALEPTRLFLGKDDFSTRPITRQSNSFYEKRVTAPPRQQRKRPSVEEDTRETGNRAERKRSGAVRLNESIAVEPLDDEVFTSFVGDNNSTVVKDRETAAAEEEKTKARSLRSPSFFLSPSLCSPPSSSSFAGKPPCVMAQKLLRPPFVRAHSSGALEMGGSARAREEEDLPSFYEQTYGLSVLEDVDCKKFSKAYGSISAETLAHEIERLGDAFTDHFILIDCRFPYEYSGGHIKYAINIPADEEIEPHFWNREMREGKEKKEKKESRFPIFYCEYSQSRGPSSADALRSIDRKIHTFPELDYPEIYLLDKGYRNFFRQLKDKKKHVLCDKRSYVVMHKSDELLLYKAQRDRKQQTSKNQKRRSLRDLERDLSGEIYTNPGVKTRSFTAAPDTSERRAVRRQRRNLALEQKEKEVSPRSKSGDDGTEKEGCKSGAEEVDKGPRLPPMSSSDSEENNKEEPEKRRDHPETTPPFRSRPQLGVPHRSLRLRLNLSSEESAP